MIFKNFELNKINLKKNKFILLYGKNEGLKNEALSILIKDKNNVQNYEEKELFELYKRFQFNLNQLLNVRDHIQLLFCFFKKSNVFRGSF